MIIEWILLKGAITTEAIIIAVVGYVVVFISLVLLFWVFNAIPRIIYMRARKKKGTLEGDKDDLKVLSIPGDTSAAISMALHLYFSELHDEESGVLTIKKVSKSYSPWSSKIYAVRNQFNRS
jgi:Na+-transporting methylmalonyl-CoA/oxaloacetate decarboxylase gamma subunit